MKLEQKKVDAKLENGFVCDSLEIRGASIKGTSVKELPDIFCGKFARAYRCGFKRNIMGE